MEALNGEEPWRLFIKPPCALLSSATDTLLFVLVWSCHNISGARFQDVSIYSLLFLLFALQGTVFLDLYLSPQTPVQQPHMIIHPRKLYRKTFIEN